jgi:hypothetical protein
MRRTAMVDHLMNNEYVVRIVRQRDILGIDRPNWHLSYIGPEWQPALNIRKSHVPKTALLQYLRVLGHSSNHKNFGVQFYSDTCNMLM